MLCVCIVNVCPVHTVIDSAWVVIVPGQKCINNNKIKNNAFPLSPNFLKPYPDKGLDDENVSLIIGYRALEDAQRTRFWDLISRRVRYFSYNHKPYTKKS